jgi:hypothetical protein
VIGAGAGVDVDESIVLTKEAGELERASLHEPSEHELERVKRYSAAGSVLVNSEPI